MVLDEDLAINGGNEPLALLLKLATDGINHALFAEGTHTIEQDGATDALLPHATANRILGLSSALYLAYCEANKLEDNPAARAQFIGVVGNGFDKSVQQTRDMLDGMGVLNGKLADSIDETVVLVILGYDAFVTGARSQPGGPMPVPGPV